MIGAEVEHLGRSQRAGGEAPAPMGSAVVGLAGRLLGAGYHHSAAHACCRPLCGGRRNWFTAALAKTVTAQQENFGVLDQPVGNGGSDGGVVEDVAPVGERGVGSDNGRALLARNAAVARRRPPASCARPLVAGR